MPTYSDEFLNHFADRYSAGRLHAHGITLDHYLANTQTYDYIATWAARYESARLHAHGVALQDYLFDPDRYEALTLEPEPLLPAQQAVAQRIAAQDATAVGATHALSPPAPGIDALTARLEAGIGHARLADSGLVEPLHHHRMPQHPGARRRFHRIGAR